MHIVCPHCKTSYAVDAAKLGAAGRTVRCARCKESWLARPIEETMADLVEALAVADAADASTTKPASTGRQASYPIGAKGLHEGRTGEPPLIDSPPIAGDWSDDAEHHGRPILTQTPMPTPRQKRPSGRSGKSSMLNLPIACTTMAALIVAMIVWRADVVRVLPQTASFYKAIGLQVNLRGLTFKDLKVASETVDGKPELLIEGVVTSQAKKPVELPRLRFSVRDQKGLELHAWNAVLDQAMLKPGDQAWFQSRLASPPPEARDIDVRFFNKRDIVATRAKA